jgi:hypothetical protein
MADKKKDSKKKPAPKKPAPKGKVKAVKKPFPFQKGKAPAMPMKKGGKMPMDEKDMMMGMM